MVSSIWSSSLTGKPISNSSHRYSILENQTCCSFKNFLKTTTGRYTTHFMLGALETMLLVPRGTTKVSAMLEKGAMSLVQSGKMGVFTPMFRCLARKPL
jgi:hypothetical protein